MTAIRAGRARAFVGRIDELSELSELVSSGAIVHLSGIAGVGKSALLEAFARDAGSAGVGSMMLDCRAVEPTARGFLRSVGDFDDVGSLHAHLQSIVAPSVVVLDHYDVFRLMDTWLRQVLVPGLPSTVALVLAGRERPVAGWFRIERFHGLPLGPLGESDACSLLERRGVPAGEARRLNRIARGHPLALTLASAGASERPELALEDAAIARVVEELTRLFCEDVTDPSTRRALEAASVARRVTDPLLTAMLGTDGDDAVRRLLELPFVEAGRDGVVVHEAARGAIAGLLRSTEPSRYRHYRRALWRALRDEVADAAPVELWRYTADMLYLLDNPAVREAFFPSAAQPLAVEPVQAADQAAVAAITRRHEGPESAALLQGWIRAAPATCSVMRDRNNEVVGFSMLLAGGMIRPPLIPGDPVVECWARHLRDYPLARGEVALGLRRWLDAERGEAPGATQAASWLDAKRTYMELRPALRRMYVVVRAVPTYWPIVERLGFLPLDVVMLDDVEYASVVLDFGPGSVDGWLAGLIASELGVEMEPSIDFDARELVVRGAPVRLTPLEFGLFATLRQREGRTTSRYDLLREVWGTDYTGGSNVVDAVVRSLRVKLGSGALAVETVRGSGYRLRSDWFALLT